MLICRVVELPKGSWGLPWMYDAAHKSQSQPSDPLPQLLSKYSCHSRLRQWLSLMRATTRSSRIAQITHGIMKNFMGSKPLRNIRQILKESYKNDLSRVLMTRTWNQVGSVSAFFIPTTVTSTLRKVEKALEILAPNFIPQLRFL